MFLTKCQTALRYKKKPLEMLFKTLTLSLMRTLSKISFQKILQNFGDVASVNVIVRKLRRNVNISGCSNDKESADGFASYFKSVFFDSSNDQVATAGFVQCYTSVFNGVQTGIGC